MIVSGVKTLIYSLEDLASGNFIMQMSMSAPVPVTMLKKDTGGRQLAVHVWAGRGIHSPPPPPPPDQLQLSTFLGFAGEKNGILKKATAFF